MTEELQKVANDPNYAVQFAVGDPAPELKAQSRDAGIRLSSVFFDEPKRYILKSAHLSREDLRVFDPVGGHLAAVSHHPGKNPYDALDPLGLTNQDARHAVAGGEWESICDVTGYRGMPSLRIRPKGMSMHGRQYVKVGDRTVMNVATMSKIKTMSVRPHFMVARGDDDDDEVYKCVGDMLGRSVTVYNKDEEVVAQIAKTSKALILTAAFGSGSESTIDVAPGVDCSSIISMVFALEQVGSHFISDAFNNYVMDPLKDNVVDGAVQAAGLEGVADAYQNASNKAVRQTHSLSNAANFFKRNFLS